MNVRLLRSGELIAAVGAIGLAIVLFVPWFGGQSAWETLTFGRFLLILEIALALTLVVFTLQARAVSLASSMATLTIGVGGPALLYALYRVGIDEPGPNAATSLDAGAYLGLFFLALIVVGAWRTLADERTDADASLRQTERVLAVRGAPRPPPPPRGDRAR